MKISIFRNIFFSTLILLSLSCEDFLGGDLNKDPNSPNRVPLGGIVPQIQISIADSYGGSFSRWNSMFTQQVEGVARQWDSFNDYDIQPVRFDDVWTNYYEDVLVELQVIKREATENEYNHYLGVIKVLEAFTIMTAADVWGDIPYTEAVLGADNFHPVFDDDEEVIYPAVLDLLNGEEGALALFDKPAGGLVPGRSADVFYAGEIDNWKKATNAILSRYYLHMANYPKALEFAKKSFSSRADNMSYSYGADPDAGQWYRFNNGREGDLEFHPTMKKLMTGLKDKDRLSKMDVTFTTTHPYLIAAFNQDLISYREIQFIIAESLQRTSGSAKDLRTAYLNGIDASFVELGFEKKGSEYTSYVGQSQIDPGEGNITLNHIMTQKYIALFVQPEVFSDWRRTGIPALEPVTGSAIPRRWQYGFNSVLFNKNVPANFDLFEPKVFWDN